MNTCPYHKLRSDLPELPKRIAKLPVDERGYPVPWFIAWPDGKPEFRMADAAKLKAAIQRKLCWVCGEPLGTHKAFLIGPMCCINRVSAEPPSHLDCAEFSAKACPFLVKPQMVRRQHEEIAAKGTNPGGIMLERNPGAMAIWVTKSYRLESDHAGGFVIRIGDPVEVSWWSQGRKATRAEVMESISTGLPHLEKLCTEPGSEEALIKAVKTALPLLPA